MAGIFDEVMDGIAAKEKQAPPPATTPAAGEQTPPPAGEQKELYGYSDDFKAKYGEHKKPA
ncbi:MAG: hypothetical protein LBS57_12410 [Treponema sp.]|jgi:hypothetical protein|nr:hypothetical protein [Treponema sp.]